MNDIYNRKDEEFTVIGEVPESFKFNDPLYKEGFKAGAASRDAKVAAIENAISIAIGSCEYMDPPDGGSVTLAEQVSRMKVERNQLREQVATLREALTLIALDKR